MAPFGALWGFNYKINENTNWYFDCYIYKWNQSLKKQPICEFKGFWFQRNYGLDTYHAEEQRLGHGELCPLFCYLEREVGVFAPCLSAQMQLEG